MKSSRGFFVVYEVICFGLTLVLLTCAAQGFVACLKQQEQELELQEAWETASMAAAGLASEEKYYTELETKEQYGYQYVEVRVYATKDGRHLCSLVEALL
ncbi:MAG: hypothetical protein ACI3WU_04635 [Phascolarctobacterium sp.]